MEEIGTCIFLDLEEPLGLKRDMTEHLGLNRDMEEHLGHESFRF